MTNCPQPGCDWQKEEHSPDAVHLSRAKQIGGGWWWRRFEVGPLVLTEFISEPRSPNGSYLLYTDYWWDEWSPVVLA